MRAPAPSLFELAPAPPPRPIQWRRAGRLLRELIDDPEDTDKVFALFDAAGGRGDEPLVRRFVAHPRGRELLRDRPSLLEPLADRAYLAGLPEGSFGRAYLAFAERNGFAADGLLQANERGLGEVNQQLDPDRRWFYERVNLTHDLWHVLCGYDTDAGGESAILAFSMAQGLASRALRLLLLSSLFIAPKTHGFGFQRFVARAYRRGSAAEPLFVQRYEELLERPIEEVRAELGIATLETAHPQGVYRVGLSPRMLERLPV